MLYLFSGYVMSDSLQFHEQTSECQVSLSFTISQSLLKFMSIESVMLSNHLILYCCFSFYLQSFPTCGSFPIPWLFTPGGQSIGASTSVSVFPVNIQSWFPLGLTKLFSLQSKRLSRVFSSSTIPNYQFFSSQPFYGPTLISIQDYWKNHGFDCTDLCC